MSFPAVGVGKRLRPDVEGPRLGGGLSSPSLCRRWSGTPRRSESGSKESGSGCGRVARLGPLGLAWQPSGALARRQLSGTGAPVANGHGLLWGKRLQPCLSQPQPCRSQPQPCRSPASASGGAAQPRGGTPPLRPTARSPSARVTGRAGPLRRPLLRSYQAQGVSPTGGGARRARGPAAAAALAVLHPSPAAPRLQPRGPRAGSPPPPHPSHSCGLLSTCSEAASSGLQRSKRVFSRGCVGTKTPA